MIVKNALLACGVRDILVSDGKIEAVGSFSGENAVDAGGKRVIPGLIDIHIHGFHGIDVSDGRLDEMCRRLCLEGTTSWLPTTMTDSADRLERITSSALLRDGAHILGFHLEGPYIQKKRRGAQNEKYIKAPDRQEFRRFQNVSVVTLAPELDGAEEFIKSCGCIVSIGHTDCDYETALKAIDAGASCLTHTFNAMPPMLHRAPGPIGAAVERGIYAEVICDGRHVARPAIVALYKMFGPDRLILISDAIRPAGMADGVYDSGGIDVIMKNGAATLADGTLAGGSTFLLQNVRTAVESGIPFYDAVKMASQTPAELLGVNKGRIEPGYDADMLILNDDFTVCDVILNGKRYQ